MENFRSTAGPADAPGAGRVEPRAAGRHLGAIPLVCGALVCGALVCVAGGASSGCVALEDFGGYHFDHDAGRDTGNDDGGVSLDAESSLDGGPRDGTLGDGDSADGDVVAACEDPCVSHATLSLASGLQGTDGVSFLADVEVQPPVEYAVLPAHPDGGFAAIPSPPRFSPCTRETCGDHAASRIEVVSADIPATVGFDPEADGAYEVVVSGFDALSGTPRDGAELRVTADSGWDLLARIRPMLGAPVRIPVELLGERRVYVGLYGGDDEKRVALDVRLDRYLGASRADCLLHLSFDGDDWLRERCAGLTFEEAAGGWGMPPTRGASIAPALGDALSLSGDAAVFTSTSIELDYASDFTVQLYARISGTRLISNALYADFRGPADRGGPGGVAIFVEPRGTDPDMLGVTIDHRPHEALGDAECDTVRCATTIYTPFPEDDAWHHYRVVRDATNETLAICIDGREVASTGFPGDLDVSVRGTPAVGLFNFQDPTPDYGIFGVIDDVRIVSTARPCLPPE